MEWLDKLHVRTVAWLALLGVIAAFGFVPLIFPGFERADDAKQISASVAAVHTEAQAREYREDARDAVDDSKSVLQLKAQECSAPKDAARDVYRQTILTLAQECRALAAKSGTAVNCDIPACGDL